MGSVGSKYPWLCAPTPAGDETAVEGVVRPGVDGTNLMVDVDELGNDVKPECVYASPLLKEDADGERPWCDGGSGLAGRRDMVATGSGRHGVVVDGADTTPGRMRDRDDDQLGSAARNGGPCSSIPRSATLVGRHSGWPPQIARPKCSSSH